MLRLHALYHSLTADALPAAYAVESVNSVPAVTDLLFSCGTVQQLHTGPSAGVFRASVPALLCLTCCVLAGRNLQRPEA